MGIDLKSVLVTGVGAIIGYGIVQSLRASNSNIHIVGTDIFEDAVGQTWTDIFEVAPLTNDRGYFEWLGSLIRHYSIDAIFPGIEQDVDAFTDNSKFRESVRTSFILNNPDLIRISRDKLKFDEFLVETKSELRIPTESSGSFERLADLIGLPFLLKPRRGYASKGIVKVFDEETFGFYSHELGSKYIAQKIIGSDEDEYSVSIFGLGDGSFCAVSNLRRRLAIDGSTAKAINCPIDQVLPAVNHLSTLFLPKGPTNLQFRFVDDRPYVMEINPRISSSTNIRRLFGHNEAQMSLDYFVDGILPTQAEFVEGRVSRYIAEVLIDDRNHF